MCVYVCAYVGVRVCVFVCVWNKLRGGNTTVTGLMFPDICDRFPTDGRLSYDTYTCDVHVDHQ